MYYEAIRNDIDHVHIEIYIYKSKAIKVAHRHASDCHLGEWFQCKL